MKIKKSDGDLFLILFFKQTVCLHINRLSIVELAASFSGRRFQFVVAIKLVFIFRGPKIRITPGRRAVHVSPTVSALGVKDGVYGLSDQGSDFGRH